MILPMIPTANAEFGGLNYYRAYCFWRFEETSGNAIEVINGLTAVPTGSPDQSNTGRSGNCWAYAVDASELHVADNDLLDFNGDGCFRISAWIKTSQQTYGYIIDKRESSGTNYNGYFLRLSNDGTIMAAVYPGGSNDYGIVSSTTTVDDGAWHYVEFRYDWLGFGGNIVVAVDGVIEDEDNFDKGSLGTSTDLHIGTDWGNYWDFSGLIDELSICVYVEPLLPTAYWPFDDGYGSHADNVCGLAEDATFSGTPTWTDGKLSGALDFHGTAYNDYASVPTHVDINFAEDFSIFAWIQTSQQTYGYILDKRGSSGADGYLLRLDSAGTVSGYVLDTDSTDAVAVTSTTTVDDGTWHHVGMVREDGNLFIFVDGVCEGVSSGADFSVVENCYLRMGTDWGLYWDFDGTIDDLMMWHTSQFPFECYGY